MSVLSKDAMERVKAMLPAEAAPSSGGSRLDVGAYLDHYQKPYLVKKTTAGALYVLLDGCLFDQSHKDAGILQTTDGHLLYKCFHASCQGHTWHEAKKLISGDDRLSPFMESEKKVEKKQPLNKLDPADLSIFLTVGDLLDNDEPDVPDLWEGEIPQGALVGISGLWGSMKSYLMQALGLRAAQGQDFLGRRLSPVDVFYFDKENSKKVWKLRMLDLAGPDRPDRFHAMTLFSPSVPPAFDPEGVAFYTKLAELQPGSLFIFDSLVRYYPGGKQTENTEDAIHAMTTLKALTKWVTVIFLHHPTKAGDVFRGGGDFQAAPDLLFTLTHDKKAKRLSLQCVKNRFDEEHAITIEYGPTPEGGLVFVDVATEEEIKRRAEDQKRVKAVLKIIEELHPNGKSTKTGLLEKGKRLGLYRRKLEPIIDKGVGVNWTCTKVGAKYIYGPMCSGDVSTPGRQNDGNPFNDKENERAHDEKQAVVHDGHDPNVNVPIVLTPHRGEHMGTNGQNYEKEHISEDEPSHPEATPGVTDFIHEGQDTGADRTDPDCQAPVDAEVDLC